MTDEPAGTARHIWDGLPESKLELIGGRLVAGNSLAGSRYLLWAILETLGPRAALPLAPLEDWRVALAAAFRAPPLRSLHDWEVWAAKVAHTPHLEPAGPRWSWDHHDARGLPREQHELYVALDGLSRTPVVDVRAVETASSRQQAALQREAVEL